MSTQTVAAATLTCYGYGACTGCQAVGDLYGLCVSVVKVGNDDQTYRMDQIKMCIKCLEDKVISVRVMPSDVIGIDTKSQKRLINRTARKRERACAEEIGGRTTPASGSGISKGDARNDHLVLDDKYTAAKQFTLKEADMVKLITEAKRTGRIGAMKIGFRIGKSNVAVLDWDDFLELINGSN